MRYRVLFSIVATSALIKSSLICFRFLIISIFCLLSFSIFSLATFIFSCEAIINLLSFSITIFISFTSLSNVALLYVFEINFWLSFFHKSLAIWSFSSIDSKPSQRENNLPLSVCPILNKLPRVYAVADITRSKSSILPTVSLIILFVCVPLSPSQFSISS